MLVITAQRFGDRGGVFDPVVDRGLLDSEQVEVAKVVPRPHGLQHPGQPQAEKDVPRTDPHDSIVPTILAGMESTGRKAVITTLDDLAALGPEELMDLYVSA